MTKYQANLELTKILTENYSGLVQSGSLDDFCCDVVYAYAELFRSIRNPRRSVVAWIEREYPELDGWFNPSDQVAILCYRIASPKA